MIDLNAFDSVLGNGGPIPRKLLVDSEKCDCAALFFLVYSLAGRVPPEDAKVSLDDFVHRLLQSKDADVVACLYEMAYALNGLNGAIPAYSEIERKLAALNESFLFYMQAYCILKYKAGERQAEMVERLEKATQAGLYTSEWLLHMMGYPHVKGAFRVPVVFFRRMKLGWRMIFGPKRSAGWRNTFWRMNSWFDSGTFYLKWKYGMSIEEPRCCRSDYDWIIRRGIFSDCLKEFMPSSSDLTK